MPSPNATRLLSPTEREALTTAILVGNPAASAADAQAIAAWACGVRWQALCLQAALEGHCGLRHDGTGAVDLEGVTTREVLARFRPSPPRPPPTPAGGWRLSQHLAQAIRLECARLGWGSETAPAGAVPLEVCATDGARRVVIDGPLATEAYDGEGLLQALVDLEPPLPWEALLVVLRSSRLP